jgi:putative FmdB family regulatory protein
MPTYDYACANCGHVIEVVHGVHDTGPTVCPQCGGLLRKRMTLPAIHFRGSGWAKKDARDAAKSSTAAAGTKARRDDHEPAHPKPAKEGAKGADAAAGHHESASGSGE